jgi:hypothetical protein
MENISPDVFSIICSMLHGRTIMSMRRVSKQLHILVEQFISRYKMFRFDSLAGPPDELPIISYTHPRFLLFTMMNREMVFNHTYFSLYDFHRSHLFEVLKLYYLPNQVIDDLIRYGGNSPESCAFYIKQKEFSINSEVFDQLLKNKVYYDIVLYLQLTLDFLSMHKDRFNYKSRCKQYISSYFMYKYEWGYYNKDIINLISALYDDAYTDYMIGLPIDSNSFLREKQQMFEYFNELSDDILEKSMKLDVNDDKNELLKINIKKCEKITELRYVLEKVNECKKTIILDAFLNKIK